MKTLITNIRNELRDSATLNYVVDNNIRVVSPGNLPPIRRGQIPFIGVAPINSSETWKTNAQREVSYNIEIYILIDYKQEEYALLGDTGKKGLLDIIADVTTVLRNHRFSNYLQTPLQEDSINYFINNQGDGIFTIVAAIGFSGSRVFLSSVN